MQKALTCNSKSIGAIAKINEDKAVRCISNLFKSVALYFDSKLSNEKAEVIATEILFKYEYRSLKLEDLVVICFRLKEADIHKLTIAKILKEIRVYSKEREQLAISRSRNQQHSINAQLEERLKKSFFLSPNADKIASKRRAIQNKFKK